MATEYIHTNIKMYTTQHLGPLTAGPVRQPLWDEMDLALRMLATLPGLAQRLH